MRQPGKFYARSASSKRDDWPFWFVANSSGLNILRTGRWSGKFDTREVCEKIAAEMNAEAHRETDRSKIIADTVRFVLSHYEQIPGGGSPFVLGPIDPDAWWSKVQLAPHHADDLLPTSRAHFEARIQRWIELAKEVVGVTG